MLYPCTVLGILSQIIGAGVCETGGLAFTIFYTDQPGGRYELPKTNGQDFDYYVTVENKDGRSGDPYAEICRPRGRYVHVEFLKRDHTAAAMVVGYTRKIWIPSNGYEARNSPLFILYDQRFHRNYQKHGCKGGTYLGDPVAVLHLPVN